MSVLRNLFHRTSSGSSKRTTGHFGRAPANSPRSKSLRLEPLEQRTLLAAVAVFDNGAYVDTSNNSYAESDNVQAALASLGHTVSTFTATNSAGIANAISGKDVLVIPEQERASLVTGLDVSARSEIASFVSSGGGLVIHGSFTYQQWTDDFLNGVFGFSLSESRTYTTLNKTAAAAGTEFADDPASIPANNGTTVLTSSLPAGSSAIYTAGTNAAVALIPYGSGQIAFLGWDWFNGAPVGSSDGGWLQVLDSAVEEVAYSNSPPVAVDDILLGGTPSVIAESENNNTLETADLVDRSDFGIATNVDVGDDSEPWVRIDGWISTSNTDDVDFYRLDLRAGEQLILDIDYGMSSGADSVDAQLHLFNSSGTRVAYNDDYYTSAGGGGSVHVYDSYIAYTVPADGYYYAAVSSYNNDAYSAGSWTNNGYSSGDYVLHASLVGGNSGGTDEDTPLTIPGSALLANDSDPDAGDTLSISSVSASSSLGAAVSLVGGNVSYNPTGSATLQALGMGDLATDTFTYTITDGNGGFDSATVTLSITGQNDAPVADDDSGDVFEDGPAVTIDLTSNDSDLDASDDLEIQSIDTSTTIGSVTVNPDNDTVSYDPNGQFEYLAVGETATDTFSYTVSDGNGGTDTALVTVTITGQNDAPVADDEAFETDEDHVLTVDVASGLLVGDTDVDISDSLSVVNVTEPAEGGTVSWNADGSFTYIPAENFNGDYVFSYEVSDGNGGTDTGEVTITVHSVVDAVIAVKPGGDPNSVNLKSKGVLPVAILSTSSTSVLEDDLLYAPDLLELAGIEFLFGDSGADHAKVNPLRVAVEDVNGDGIQDLIFHFDMEELTADPGTGEKPALDAETVDAVLTATWGGAASSVDLSGSDSIRIVPPSNGNGNGKKN